ncbi:MAG: heparinase II/III family protein, partial [Bacteroidota bacterium]
SWWADKDTNWNPICNAGMVFGAIVTREFDPDLYDRIIRRAESSARLAISAYEPDGVYPEGYTYWSYGTTFLVMLLDAMERSGVGTYGPETYPGFYRTAGYIQHMIGPTGMNFNYSDGVSNSSVNPAMFWFARRLKNPAVLTAELTMMRTLKSMSWIPELPMLLVWGHTLDLTGKPQPANQEFIGKGKNPVAMFRSDWTDQAMYIGLKAGSPSVSHGHMDAGSFILEALGERWAIDAGKQDYNGLESKGIDIWSFKQNSDRWKVFRNSNLSHNTLTFNGQLQYVQGHSAIVSVVNKPNLRGAVAELSGVYPYAALGIKRGVALSGKEIAVVRDEIITRSGPEASMQWTMLTPASVKVTAPNRAELMLNGKKLFMAVTG